MQYNTTHSYIQLLYTVLTIYLFIGQEPTAYFGNQRNLQISQLSNR